MFAFEFDPAKSAANKKKHGVDFVEAQALWDDADRVERPARSTTEPRVQVIGAMDVPGERAMLFSAFVTVRHDNQTIRIISVRRCRPDERALYRDERPDVRDR